MAFRICVIGCGGMSTAVHGPSLRRYAESHDEVLLAACCDLDPERATVTLRDHTFLLHLPIAQAVDRTGRLQHFVRDERVEDLDGATLDAAQDAFVAGGFYAENASFFDDLRAGRRPAGDIRSGLQAVEIADAMRLRLPEYAACG